MDKVLLQQIAEGKQDANVTVKRKASVLLMFLAI